MQPHLPWQMPGAAAVRRGTDCAVRHQETCIVGRDQNVARQGQRQSEAGSGAVDQTQHRTGQLRQSGYRFVDGTDQGFQLIGAGRAGDPQ